MRRMLFPFWAIALLFFSSNALALTITPFDSAANFAQSLLGPGITISNISYTGATAASGYFTGGVAAGIGIESGIVLTSGFASNLNGTANTNDAITGNNSLSGDVDLNGLIPSYTTYDATILSFDFVSSGDGAYFNYVFGSDEYNEWVGSAFNDVFGFFFDGANVALLPGTTTPVSINNVNNGLNPSFYHSNDLSDGPAPFAFEYDGFTSVLTASITGLTAGQVYGLKLAIADAGDHILDSGVFLQAGSFSNTPVDPGAPVPEPATMLLVGTGLFGLMAAGKKRKS